jgi:hypothetical protein
VAIADGGGRRALCGFVPSKYKHNPFDRLSGAFHNYRQSREK